MNFELSNALCDLEVLKERIDDVVTSFVWFNDDYFTHNPSYMLNKKDILNHGYRYHEHRIQNTQTIDLMCMYLKEFDSLLEQFKELDKKEPLSESDQTTDNEQLKK